ncbi:MAG: hypothetical protein ACXWJM_08945 [Ramlibacter sp.]
MTGERWAIYFAVTGFATVALGCLAGMWAMGMHPRLAPLAAASAQVKVAGPRPAPQAPPLTVAAKAVAALAAPLAEPVAPAKADEAYYARLRSEIHWVPTRLGREMFMAPDFTSRVLLAKSAAQRAGLGDVGLGFQDVYGVITAETSWVPRVGSGRNGTASYGVAQFEPTTAKALGLRDPEDMVEAVHAAARHMKEAAEWSRARIAGLRLDAGERALRLREGVSVYYNLSSRGRAAWNGRNTGALPMATRQHILNARVGALEAGFLEAQMRASKYGAVRTVAVASSAGGS